MHNWLKGMNTSASNFLCLTISWTRTALNRCFVSVVNLSLWNSLPVNVRYAKSLIYGLTLEFGVH